MSILDFSEFIWFLPKKRSNLCITIPNPHSVNLNPKLVAVLPGQITFGIRGIDTICIKQDDTGYKVPKGGSIKARELLSALTDRGLSIPARYTVTAEGSYWIATLESTPSPPPIDLSKVSRKPRRKGLDKFLDQGGSNEKMR